MSKLYTLAAACGATNAYENSPKIGFDPEAWERFAAALSQPHATAQEAAPFGWFYEMNRNDNPKAGPVYLGSNDQKITQMVAADEGAEAFPLYRHAPAPVPPLQGAEAACPRCAGTGLAAYEFKDIAAPLQAVGGQGLTDAWNRVRKEARAIAGSHGIGDLLSAVDAYALAASPARAIPAQEQAAPVPAEFVREKATEGATHGAQPYDPAIEALRRAFCALPKHSFLLSKSGGVCKVEDRSGRWIDFQAAHELFDPAKVDSLLASSTSAKDITQAAPSEQEEASPLDFRCPWCGAQPGVACSTTNKGSHFDTFSRGFHFERRNAALKGAVS